MQQPAPRGECAVTVACLLPSVGAPSGGGSSAHGEFLGDMASTLRSFPSQALASLMGVGAGLQFPIYKMRGAAEAHLSLFQP